MYKTTRWLTAPFALSALAIAVTPNLATAEEFSAFDPIVEINATDGDVGFHVLLDGDPWKRAKIYDGDGDRMFKGIGTDDLDEQGITELFMESAEPPCWDDGEVDEDEIVTVEEFMERFEAGTYSARGRTIDGERLTAEGVLTHDLPAAPHTEYAIDGDEVTISWSGGDDLGNCAVPDGMDPGSVDVVRWEVVVEPNVDELPGGELPPGVPFGKLTIQLPADVTSLEVPDEFMAPYLDADVTEFKGEVGAKEVSGNQTFTEFEFSTDEEDD